MDALNTVVRVDDSGLSSAAWKLLEEPIADLFKVLKPPFFESVVTSLDSLCGNLGVDIQHNGHIGHAAGCRDPADAPKILYVQPTSRALVNHIRQQEAIAHNGDPGGQGWADVFGHELGASGHVQEHFGGVGQRDILAVQEDLSDG